MKSSEKSAKTSIMITSLSRAGPFCTRYSLLGTRYPILATAPGTRYSLLRRLTLLHYPPGGAVNRRHQGQQGCQGGQAVFESGNEECGQGDGRDRRDAQQGRERMPGQADGEASHGLAPAIVAAGQRCPPSAPVYYWTTAADLTDTR